MHDRQSIRREMLSGKEYRLMVRNQFTFYLSYYKALSKLSKNNRFSVLWALIEYALFGKIPTDLNKTSSACFDLVKPTIDSGRKQAAYRISRSKHISENNEKENEGEKESEREYECECECENDRNTHTPKKQMLRNIFLQRNTPSILRLFTTITKLLAG